MRIKFLSFGFTFLTAYITKLEGIFSKKKVYRVCLPQNFFLMFVRNLKRHTAFLFIQDKKSTIEWGVIQTMYKYYRCIALADFRLFDINASLWRQVFLGFITYLTNVWLSFEYPVERLVHNQVSGKTLRTRPTSFSWKLGTGVDIIIGIGGIVAPGKIPFKQSITIYMYLYPHLSVHLLFKKVLSGFFNIQ